MPHRSQISSFTLCGNKPGERQGVIYPNMKITKVVLISAATIIVGVPLYALPATLTLPGGSRPDIARLTIPQAAQQLRAGGKTGWDLVEAARVLVATRMQYSRRNSFDSAAKAFERGYGYCTQQAYALTHILLQLGIRAEVVQAFRNRFPDGTVGSHAWVRVQVGLETRDIDTLFYDSQSGELAFTPLSRVTYIGPLFKLVAWWGASAVNAHRYYVTGKDE